MKRCCIWAFALVLIVTAQNIHAEEKGSMSDHMDPAMVEMMQKWQNYSTPNDNHKVLNKLVGSWTYTSKMWQAPNTPAEESSGTTESQWIMGGRFLQQDVTGAYMGQPFHGMSLMGYNNIKQKYTSIWLDDMSTGIMVGEGTFDQASNTINDEGDFTCPMVNGERPYRTVTTFIDEDHFKYEMYMTDAEGTEFKGMEIMYTRS